MYKIKQTILIKLASLFRVNLLGTAYKGLGIGQDSDIRRNGEEFFLKSYLPKILKDSNEAIFDVGMNKGEYSELLLEYFPHHQIHGIEPNIALMAGLRSKFASSGNMHIHNFAISDSLSIDKLYVYKDDPVTGHASLNRGVLEILHNFVAIDSIDVETTTLSELCKYNGISHIDFLKIDIEGYELKALQSLGNLLEKVKVIQIEFNEMNILSRVFMFDFFTLLKHYNAYRLLPNGIFPLKKYNSTLEVFRYQNVVFINKAYDCFAS